MVWALLGCLAAVKPGVGGWEGPVFHFQHPRGWEVVKNHRFLGRHVVVMTNADGPGDITVELYREDKRTRAKPLSLVSDVYAANLGWTQGYVITPLGQHQIEVANREAWVTDVVRRHGPNERRASVVMLRGDRRLVVITLSTVEGSPRSVYYAFDQVLSSFEMPYDAPPEHTVQDTLLFAPDDPE